MIIELSFEVPLRLGPMGAKALHLHTALSIAKSRVHQYGLTSIVNRR
jgi:hypothetical protein